MLAESLLRAPEMGPLLVPILFEQADLIDFNLDVTGRMFVPGSPEPPIVPGVFPPRARQRVYTTASKSTTRHHKAELATTQICTNSESSSQSSPTSSSHSPLGSTTKRTQPPGPCSSSETSTIRFLYRPLTSYQSLHQHDRPLHPPPPASLRPNALRPLAPITPITPLLNIEGPHDPPVR